MRGKASSFASYYFPHVALCHAFCADSFARSRERTWSEGEIKERRQLMQLITDLAAIVFWLVSSKSSGAPLGKMRGLITVKLANEQVNYGAKFLYKKCHFSERRSSSRTAKPQASCGRRRGGAGGKTEDKSLFLHFCFKNSLWFPQLWAQKHTVWGWEEALASMSFFYFFFSRGNFFPLPFPLTQETASVYTPSSTPAFYPVSRSQAFIFTPQWSLWDAEFCCFFLTLSVLQRACTKKKFLSHRLKFARTFALMKKKKEKKNPRELP